jgi:hypothetical protein
MPPPAPSLPQTAQYGLVPLNPDGSITVKIAQAGAMDVNITGVNTFNTLPVNIAEVNGNRVFEGIPVKQAE